MGPAENRIGRVDGTIEAQPLSLGVCSETTLELYGTGRDYATASAAQVMFDQIAGTVQYAGPGGGFPGLDRINVMIPQSLAGSVNITIQYGRSVEIAPPRTYCDSQLLGTFDGGRSVTMLLFAF